MTSSVNLKVLGCGDAFGSGGRLNTCFFVEVPRSRFLIDCGATSLVALKAHGLSSDDIDEVVITHFHGDHFGGLPFLLLEAAVVQKRKRPITLFSPPGLEEKLEILMESLYPGTASRLGQLDIIYAPYRSGVTQEEKGISVTAYPVDHAPGSFPHAVRVGTEGRTIAFSGDTEWTDTLYTVADGADLFLCECNSYETTIPGHIDYKTLLEKVEGLGCEQLFLTHLGPEMLARQEELEIPALREGDTFSL